MVDTFSAARLSTARLLQVETERREVLRLSAALNDIRSAAGQDMQAAQDREAALTALLASETEVSSRLGVVNFLIEKRAKFSPNVVRVRVFVGVAEAEVEVLQECVV